MHHIIQNFLIVSLKRLQILILSLCLIESNLKFYYFDMWSMEIITNAIVYIFFFCTKSSNSSVQFTYLAHLNSDDKFSLDILDLYLICDNLSNVLFLFILARSNLQPCNFGMNFIGKEKNILFPKKALGMDTRDRTGLKPRFSDYLFPLIL